VPTLALFTWFISRQAAVLFSQNKPAISIFLSRTNQHQPSATSQTNMLPIYAWCHLRADPCNSFFTAQGKGHRLLEGYYIYSWPGPAGGWTTRSGKKACKSWVDDGRPSEVKVARGVTVRPGVRPTARLGGSDDSGRVRDGNGNDREGKVGGRMTVRPWQ
jgi:hypothetical protein